MKSVKLDDEVVYVCNVAPFYLPGKIMYLSSISNYVCVCLANGVYKWVFPQDLISPEEAVARRLFGRPNVNLRNVGSDPK